MGARSEEFEADTIIIREGEKKHRMYIVLEGEVILYNNYGTDGEYLIGVYGKGKSFGEFNLFTDDPYIFTAVAYTYVKVAWFEKNNLGSFINGYPDLALNLIESISKSYILMAKSLRFAIDEINDLRELTSNYESTVITDNSSNSRTLENSDSELPKDSDSKVLNGSDSAEPNTPASKALSGSDSGNSDDSASATYMDPKVEEALRMVSHSRSGYLFSDRKD